VEQPPLLLHPETLPPAVLHELQPIVLLRVYKLIVWQREGGRREIKYLEMYIS